MLRKKICMLGGAGVGKTSLTRRYVDAMFSDAYLSTVGVKIDHKQIDVDGTPLGLVIWDVQGQDEARSIRPSFLKGAAGYALVVDLSRPESLDVAIEVRDAVRVFVGDLPYVLVLNKSDLVEPGELDVSELADDAATTVMASAKLDTGVDELFRELGLCLVNSAR